jgi:hypothetical protein
MEVCSARLLHDLLHRSVVHWGSELPTAPVEPTLIAFHSDHSSSFGALLRQPDTSAFVGAVFAPTAVSAESVAISPAQRINPQAAAPDICAIRINAGTSQTEYDHVSSFLLRHLKVCVYLHPADRAEPPLELSARVVAPHTGNGSARALVVVDLAAAAESITVGSTLEIRRVSLAGVAVPTGSLMIPITAAVGMNTPLLLKGTTTNYPGTPCISRSGQYCITRCTHCDCSV